VVADADFLGWAGRTVRWDIQKNVHHVSVFVKKRSDELKHSRTLFSDGNVRVELLA
jgi:hypothetical protein